MTFQVVIVEDDLMVQELHRQFIEQVSGFEVVGMASNGADGVKMVEELKPDLVILDFYMPSLNGLQVIKTWRSYDIHVDVIAITAAKDLDTIQTMFRNGVFDYIIKPFTFDRMKQTLVKYREFVTSMNKQESLTQAQLDSMFKGGFHESKQVKEGELPKGLNPLTMHQIKQILNEQNTSISAEEVAEKAGLARVTARRYLEYLEKTNVVELDIRYGGVGRPINRYLLKK